MPKRGVGVAIYQKGLSGIIQDIPQVEALRTPVGSVRIY